MALNSVGAKKCVPHSDNLIKIGSNLTLFKNGLNYEPLYLHSFKIDTASHVKFTETNKLRYYRLKKGLRQIDVAKHIGITRNGYVGYEACQKEYYNPKIMNKLANLFEVDVYDLLDDYNRFIYDGQGKNIKKIRKELGITQKELAELMDTEVYKIKRFEQEKVRISKYNWERLMSIAVG